MLTSVLLAAVLAAPCPPQGRVIAVPDIAGLGFSFVMEISGSAIDQRLADLAGSKIDHAIPTGGKMRVEIDRVVADAYAPPGTSLRVLANVAVSLDCAGCVTRSRATLFFGARLAVESAVGQAPSLKIEPVAETMVVTDDSRQAAAIESAIRDAAPQIASKLAAALPLETLSVLARSCSAGCSIVARAYNLGFAWILQLAGTTAPRRPVPRVFQQGDLFTLILSRDAVRGLAASEFTAGHLPTRMNEQGLVDANGTVRVTGISADIEQDAFVVCWLGDAGHGRHVTIRWRMAFISTAAGLGLEITKIDVDGKSRPVPKDVINPVDDLIKNIAIGPKRTGLFISPVGRMRLTTGRVTPDAVLVAGRV